MKRCGFYLGTCFFVHGNLSLREKICEGFEVIVRGGEKEVVGISLCGEVHLCEQRSYNRKTVKSVKVGRARGAWGVKTQTPPPPHILILLGDPGADTGFPKGGPGNY